MTAWNFDPTDIPRDKTHIWAFTPGGAVLETWWIEPTKTEREGRWHNMNSKHEPIAWTLFLRPAPPTGYEDQGAADLLPIIDDCGGGA